MTSQVTKWSSWAKLSKAIFVVCLKCSQLSDSWPPTRFWSSPGLLQREICWTSLRPVLELFPWNTRGVGHGEPRVWDLSVKPNRLLHQANVFSTPQTPFLIFQCSQIHSVIVSQEKHVFHHWIPTITWPVTFLYLVYSFAYNFYYFLYEVWTSGRIHFFIAAEDFAILLAVQWRKKQS